MTDTERGRALLEARRDRIVTHTNVEDVRIKEFRAFIDLALAADRRRQAYAETMVTRTADTFHDTIALYQQARADEDAALDKLLAHLAGEAT
jgi:hypothetical protein